MGRVHFDWCIAQFVREVNSESVERCFGSVVSEDLMGIDWRRGIGVESQGAHDAGDIHDSSRRRFSDKGKQPLGKRYGTEEICLKGFPQNFHRKGGGRVGARNKAARGGTLLPNSGVVDQDIELSLATFEKVKSFGMSGCVGHVEANRIRFNALFQ
jgi:hypothetical protein